MRPSPGPDTHSELGNRILKVNHAGEHGAVNIYRGQRVCARFTAPPMMAELQEFLKHEERHRRIFAAELARRNHPRCRSYGLCGVGGFALGLVTGVLGAKAIAATTVAVERVVLAHLSAQLVQLADTDAQASNAIARIIADEQEHYERSVVRLDAGGFWPGLLMPVIAAATEAVIWVGMRI